MPSLEIISINERMWETGGFPLCTIAISVTELATIHGLPLDHWEEDGLGDASGFAARIPSGLKVLAQEFAHATTPSDQQGPTIYVDAEQIVANGPDMLIADVMQAFSLSPSNLAWVQAIGGMEGARNICESAAQFAERQKRND